MNQYIFLGCLFSIAIAILIINKSTNKSKNLSKSEYTLANRKLGIFSLTLTLLATQLGGGVILGSAEAAYEYGITAIFYTLGLSCGLFTLALGLGAKFRSQEVSTIPELFIKLGASNCLRKFIALVLVISMFLILVALSVATSKFFFSVGLKSNFAYLTFWGIIIAYTSFGGLGAVIKTEIFQIIIVLSGLIITAMGLYYYDVFNLSMFVNPVATKNAVPWSSWILMPMCFVIIGQDMGQRCFAARSPKIVSKATCYAGILLILSSLLPVILGLQAKILNLEVSNSSVLIDIALKLTNPVIASFFAISILTAILSTADALLCAISSSITCDLLPDNSKLFTAKLLTMLAGIAAVICAMFYDSIIEIMVIAYELSVSIIFMPLILGIFTKNNSAKQFVLACFIGGISDLILITTDIEFIIPRQFICLILSATGFFIGKILNNDHLRFR